MTEKLSLHAVGRLLKLLSDHGVIAGVTDEIAMNYHGVADIIHV